MTGTRSRRWRCNTCKPSSRGLGRPGPQVIGIYEIAIRKGHNYRIVVSDLVARSADLVRWQGPLGGEHEPVLRLARRERKSSRIRLAVMDMWKPFRLATRRVRRKPRFCSTSSMSCGIWARPWIRFARANIARLACRDRRYIKGHKYTLLSRKENLTLDGKKALKTLLAANKRLNTAYVLKESFGQLWSYRA